MTFGIVYPKDIERLRMEKRAILIRDLTTNRPVYDEIPKFLNTPHNIILLETKLDKRSATYKEIKDKIKIKEFSLPENQNLHIALSIFSTAKTDGKRAVAMLGQIEQNEDPIMFLGLLASQALKDFSLRHGAKEVRILKDLAKTDLAIKTTKVEPWLLIKSFLLRLKSI